MIGAYFLDSDRFISTTTGFDSGTGIELSLIHI